MVCGKNDYKKHEIFGHKGQYRYVECTACLNIYLNPRPLYNQDFTSIAYDEYGMSDDIVKVGISNDVTKNKMKRYQVVLNVLDEKYHKKGKILDLGCATGEFLLAARESGWRPYGIDISKPMVEYIKNNLGFEAKAGQFQELDLTEWGEFDVIYSSHVIEHIPNPNEWMASFKKYLKPDGILLLNIPNQLAPEKKLQRFLKKIKLRRPTWRPWRTPDHLYEPHIKSIKYLLKKNNLNLLDIYTYSSRETLNEGLLSNLYHKKLKWGSKIRLFARK